MRWCQSEQIPTVNTLSSNNWRIFCFRTLPRQSVQLKHICHRRDKFTIISNSSLTVLSFEPTTICHVIPPGTAPKLMISPWNCVQLVGCGIIFANIHQQIADPVEEERASKFSVDNHSKGTPKRSQERMTPNELEKNPESHGDRDKDETRIDSTDSARLEGDIMDDDAFSFWGYGSIASEDESQERQEIGPNGEPKQGEAQLGHPLQNGSKVIDTVNGRLLQDVPSSKLTVFAEKESSGSNQEPDKHEIEQAIEPPIPRSSSPHQAEHCSRDIHLEVATKAVTSDEKAARLGSASKRASKTKLSQVKAKASQQTVLQQLQKKW